MAKELKCIFFRPAQEIFKKLIVNYSITYGFRLGNFPAVLMHGNSELQETFPKNYRFCNDVDNYGHCIVDYPLNSVADGQLLYVNDALSLLDISIKSGLLQREYQMTLPIFITLGETVNSTQNEPGRSPLLNIITDWKAVSDLLGTLAESLLGVY